MTVRLSARLSRYGSGRGLETLHLPGVATVADLLTRLGIPAGEAPIIVVAGRPASLETAIADGDTIELFPPPVSGG